MAAQNNSLEWSMWSQETKVKVIPSGAGRARLKTYHKHIDPALYDGLIMPLVQLQMFIALVIWQVQLQRLRN